MTYGFLKMEFTGLRQLINPKFIEGFIPTSRYSKNKIWVIGGLTSDEAASVFGNIPKVLRMIA